MHQLNCLPEVELLKLYIIIWRALSTPTFWSCPININQSTSRCDWNCRIFSCSEVSLTNPFVKICTVHTNVILCEALGSYVHTFALCCILKFHRTPLPQRLDDEDAHQSHHRRRFSAPQFLLNILVHGQQWQISALSARKMLLTAAIIELPYIAKLCSLRMPHAIHQGTERLSRSSETRIPDISFLVTHCTCNLLAWMTNNSTLIYCSRNLLQSFDKAQMSVHLRLILSAQCPRWCYRFSSIAEAPTCSADFDSAGSRFALGNVSLPSVRH